MSQQRWEGEWNQVSGAVKEKYGEITDDELRETEGSLQKLTGLIQEKTGQTREQVEDFLHSISQRTRAGYEYSTESIAKRPAESVVAAFTVGVVTGIAIGLSIVGRRSKPTWRDRLHV